MAKEKIPKALREQVWITHVGRKFESKCLTTWCKNTITVFDFQSGHNVPESKGGSTDISNLYPICSRCNLSMSDTFTFDEWCKQSKALSKWKHYFNNLLPKKWTSSGIKETGIQSSQSRTNLSAKHTTLHGVLFKNNLLPVKKRTGTGTRVNKKK